MDVDNCIGHHCSEHGVCLDQQYNYTCRCELGFQGSYCEQETDECKNSPCVNGATCEDVIGGYQCHCPPGFEGRPTVCYHTCDNIKQLISGQRTN
ncbi:unnamed protein product [Oncorhynchus mykiss]|uniref:EGF-like domain-containing protein n=1 Tax=Oncorhynchus mykiss TaxID=8022 RepID=A0A060Z8S9_ONCMY|nr:unnamed protein product [Oncorhynchus mykiss]